MNSPITCNGNDLAQVCEDLVARNFVVCAVDAMVKTNAGYRVSYFERGDTPDEGSSSKDKRQASENHSGKVATVRGLLPQDAGRGRNAITRKASGVCSDPAALIQFAGEDRSTRSGHASATAIGSAPMKSAPVPVVAVGHTGNSISIEDRLAALQERMAASGKIRRSKP